VNGVPNRELVVAVERDPNPEPPSVECSMPESAVDRETAFPDLDAPTLVFLAVEAPERDAIAVLAPAPRDAVEPATEDDRPEFRAALDAPLLPPNECHCPSAALRFPAFIPPRLADEPPERPDDGPAPALAPPIREDPPPYPGTPREAP
jgi:hypothetical protein